MPKPKEKIFYAVGVGHKVGVYDTWKDCKQQVDGVTNPKFRKFNTLEEAEEFVKRWQGKGGQNVSASPSNSRQHSSGYESRINDKSQGDHHGQETKGDTSLETHKKKKKKKQGCDKEIEIISNNNKSSNNKRKEANSVPIKEANAMHSKEASATPIKVHGHSRMRITWDENGEIQNKEKYSITDTHPFYGRNQVEGKGESNSRRNQFKNQNFSCSANERYYRKRKGDFWQRNSNTNRPITSRQRSRWNTTNSFNNLQVWQTHPVANYSNYEQYPTAMERNSNYTQGNNTADCSSFTEIVNEDVCNIASIPLPIETNVPSEMSVDKQGLANNDSNSVNNQTNTSEKESSENSTPCKTSESHSQTEEKTESETNEGGGSISDNEGSETGATSLADELDSKTDDIAHDLSEALKKRLETLANLSINEKCISAVTDSLRNILDVVGVVLKEINSVKTGDSHKSEGNDFPTIKVPQTRECRNSNSFSGELEPNVGKDSSRCNDMEEMTEGGDAADIATFQDKVGACERKVDFCVGKIGEILSNLTDIKNELIQLKMLIPRSCATLSKETVQGGKIDSRIWTPGLSRAFRANVDTGDGDGASWRQDSQRSRTVKIEPDVNSQASPAKRKRTWDDQSSAGSQEPRFDKEIKQERREYVSFTTDEEDYVVVYTDGSCTDNGTSRAKAGIGIWFDDGHPLNVSRPLTGVEPTNNNAEIQAARIACELALSAGITKLKICTDSEFLINCITKWVHRWKANGWSTAANRPVKNREELERLLDVASRLSVRWEKVAGHSDIKGNEMADRLANDGAASYVNR